MAQSGIDKIIEGIKQERDELRVKLHLAKADAKDEWDKLEHRWEQFEERWDKRSDELEDQFEERADEFEDKAETQLKRVAEELKAGYGRLKKMF